MKNTTIFLTLLSLLAVACGNTDDAGGGDGGTQGGVDGGNGGTAIQCSAVGWCTTWEADSDSAVDAPALTGGALRDGIYRLEQGQGAEAMVIQGSSILFVEGQWSNSVGTWSVTGGRLAINLATYCDDYSEGDRSYAYAYAFAVQGEDLFTQEEGKASNPIQRWRRVAHLCEASASFKCRVRNCACVTTTNKSLHGQGTCS
ncbi:hypothetical protein [Corallococcus sp. Z5C101001]|uniref:hypothetical protein n=1 Tax=Corallococcus sp. Z5C101001 TaxID=2596829 RepID=UPI00117C749F|nr:hypothetical protein [Corallococcus sp. Z5C101001]TSC32337.1 hypothetical protein FOF48_09845 [Corallococcus sp. Z5C101001]